MPTPFNHLAMAEDVLADPALGEVARHILGNQRGAFLFGNTAPDVQVVSGQSREATHFFNIPRTDDTPGQVTMFRQYPELADPETMTGSKAAFLAGYLCHLTLDELWLDRIFGPYFIQIEAWGDFRRRLMLHNVLRTHLDRLDLARLPENTERHMRQAVPDTWLPFTADPYLLRWRDEIADQLLPGASSRTVEVFAKRMRMPPEELEAYLEPGFMADTIFRYLPEIQLQAFQDKGRERSVQVINDYLRHVPAEADR
jgi:hypothetical protein